ncbi:MAG TPA: glycosyltransferase family 87 protein [Xanthobacteraceae bacterium]|nr:glycosyltransferase family 87 protein [Xanthobacteraceae bacterium]
MTTYEMSPAHGAGAKLARPVELVCFALLVANGVYLADSYVQGIWLVAPDGSGLPSDFVNVWAAGRMALAGHAAAAYDWPTHKLVEESGVGHPFDGYYGWPYPPTFLFAAAAVSLLPYLSAYIFWVSGTFLAYLAAIRAIIGDRVGYLLAAAFPAVLANSIVGQNGFFSASLIGGALALMERRPICAGVLLGLLTYKPHLGLLFPIALMASGRWRVFVTAGIVTALTAAASWAAFGSESWQAFLPGIGHTSQALLSNGTADWGKLQTAFGLTRALGGGEALGWTVQIALALIAAGAIAVLWRSRATYEIKAAALGTGTLLATPYLFTYDLVVLAVPLAFLFRLGRARGFLAHEVAGMGLACLLILIFPFVKAPVGFGAVLVVAALIVRRALAPRSANDLRDVKHLRQRGATPPLPMAE